MSLGEIVSLEVSGTPSSKQRMHTLGLLFRMGIGSFRPMPRKKFSMAMLVDEADLARRGFADLHLVQERAFPPVKRKDIPWSPRGIVGITAQRAFLRPDPPSDLVARVTPYSSEELALANVEHAGETIMHNPTKQVETRDGHKKEDLQIEGLPNLFAYEETNVVKSGTFKTMWIFSHVGQVGFSIQISSKGDFWTWEEASSLATTQAEKVQRNMGVVANIFDAP
jgi:hypothetical protein